MPLVKQTHITREEIRNNPDKFYVFGDNMARKGFGGQAKEMRGEPNSIGIPTKWIPSTDHFAYFDNSDWDNRIVRQEIIAALVVIRDLLEKKVTVIIPSAGLGTGHANLSRRAPIIADYIHSNLILLEEEFGS